MNDSPYRLSKLVPPDGQILQQMVISYYREDGCIKRCTVKRSFTCGDWQDTQTVETLAPLGNKEFNPAFATKLRSVQEI